ncbi:TetR/AcrR family transcriptional regulator [Ectothiorhodospiraceae bacterium WFHF3C12]|nr:TetR/AcrR family transcriptional regulator [Ectothiorhodospiraceae bacterium WFHF3C12]
MFTEMSKRKYTLRRRAEQQQQTRERIVQATAELHEELGPRNTTVSAIAERAGVQRLTVYRHFPDDETLFAACTSHWLAGHPPPDPADWQAITDPADRTRRALGALYAYYRRTARMWFVSYRDVHDVAALHGPMGEFEAYLDSVRDDLAAAWGQHHRNERLTATLGLAVGFHAWRLLDQQGMDDAQMAELVIDWIRCINNP